MTGGGRAVPRRGRRATLVAVCGIDGAGKSSVVERLAHHLARQGAVAVAKRSRRHVEAVLESYSGWNPTAEAYHCGPFAEAIRWAHARDFLHFYEEEVVPYLGCDALLLSDRWSICSISYADAGPGLGRAIRGLLARVEPPDLLVYLDVAPEEAVRRIRRRGAQQANEDVSILRGCALAYDRWLKELSSPILRVRNDDLDETCRLVSAAADQTLRDRAARGSAPSAGGGHAA